MLTLVKWVRMGFVLAAEVFVLSGGFAFAVKPPPDPTATVTYEIEMLGFLNGATNSIACGTNNSGDVVGRSGGRAFVSYNVDGVHVMLDLNGLLTMTDQARWDLLNADDINDLGQIVGVGRVTDGSGNQYATVYRFTPGSPAVIEDLGIDGDAMSINNLGEVAGTRINTGSSEYVFIYHDADVEVTTLPYFDEAYRMHQPKINLYGQVTGKSSRIINTDPFMGESYRAWRYTPGLPIENLGVIKKSRGSVEESAAYDINDNGDVVGDSTAGGFGWKAFLYTDTAGMVNLGTLGGNNSRATGINNNRNVTGWAQTADGAAHIFLYNDTLGMAKVVVNGDLPASVTTSYNMHINDFGEISGTLGGTIEAFVMTPVLPSK